jgi:hypothetical protein
MVFGVCVESTMVTIHSEGEATSGCTHLFISVTEKNGQNEEMRKTVF